MERRALRQKSKRGSKLFIGTAGSFERGLKIGESDLDAHRSFLQSSEPLMVSNVIKNIPVTPLHPIMDISAHQYENALVGKYFQYNCVHISFGFQFADFHSVYWARVIIFELHNATGLEIRKIEVTVGYLEDVAGF